MRQSDPRWATLPAAVRLRTAGVAEHLTVCMKFQIQPDHLVILGIQEGQGDLNGPQTAREIQWKKRVMEYAEQIGNVRKACRYYGVARSTFYLWRARYRELGDEGLMHRGWVAHNHPNKTPAEVVGKILHLRRTYHLGPLRIVWYLERYHNSTRRSPMPRVYGH
jgi:hypothetical protein